MKHLLPFLIAFLLTSLMATAQIYESYKHVPPTVSTQGRMGSSIDINDDWAVVGAPGEANNGGVTTGGVHIYHRENEEWVYFGKKQPFDFTEDFGERVAIEGEWMAVAAPDDDFNPPTSGAVYMYRYFSGEWNYQVKLTHPESISASFGQDVELDEGRLAVGTFDNDYELARVYIYTLQGGEWEVDAEISPAIPEDNAFGFRLELDGPDLAVVALGLIDGGGTVGSFYQFEYDGSQWQEIVQVFGPSEEDILIQGIDVAMKDDHILLMLPLAENAGTAQNGVVYYYSKSNGVYSFDQSINSPYEQFDLRFGSSADIDGDKLLIGALTGLDTQGLAVGSCYEYEFIAGQWSLADSLYAFEAEWGVNFGNSVKFFEQGCMVGATGNSEIELGGGAVYFFEDLFVSLPEEEQLLEFSLYPNPSAQYIKVIGLQEGAFDYKITDIQGRVVQAGSFLPFGTYRVPLSDLEDGIYQLTLFSDSSSGSRLFVKE